jgi:acyl-CoA synthetase (AMP-forming)/AMP-acid ligase II
MLDRKADEYRGLNYHQGRVGYLWTLHMFHALGLWQHFITSAVGMLTHCEIGWTFPWAVTLVCGTHYCLRKIDCTKIWRLLQKGNITHFNASPIISKLLCGHPLAKKLPKPVHVTVAGSSPTPHLFEAMTRLNLRPVHVYGLTETYGPITKGYPMDNIPPKEKYQRMVRQGHGSVTSLPIRVIKPGLPDGKIVNVKQDGKEMGEVVFEGNICAKGYYKNPEATKKLFAGGVLHSDDGAVWHEDGSFQVLGRQEDIIIIGNYLIAFYSSYYYKCRSQPADTDSNTNRRGKVLFPRP